MWIAWLISLLILSLSTYRLIAYIKKTKRYYKVVATVIGNDVKTVDGALIGPQYFYASVVTFTDNKGIQQQMICGEENQGRPIYKEGELITLLVDPANSGRFLVYDFVNGYLIPFIWIAIGISVVAVPYLFPDSFR